MPSIEGVDGGKGHGVFGGSDSGDGVYGSSTNTGVHGFGYNGPGVYGESNGNRGGWHQ